jgi:hypothetical protein
VIFPHVVRPIDDDDRKYTGGDHRPDQLELVVVWLPERLAILAVDVLSSEPEQEDVGEHEGDQEDPSS